MDTLRCKSRVVYKGAGFPDNLFCPLSDIYKAPKKESVFIIASEKMLAMSDVHVLML